MNKHSEYGYVLEIDGEYAPSWFNTDRKVLREEARSLVPPYGYAKIVKVKVVLEPVRKKSGHSDIDYRLDEIFKKFNVRHEKSNFMQWRSQRNCIGKLISEEFGKDINVKSLWKEHGLFLRRNIDCKWAAQAKNIRKLVKEQLYDNL